MKTWHFIIDVEKCENCNNSFLACKDEHCGNDWPGCAAEQPRHGHRWMNIHARERGRFPVIDVAYLPMPCMHCADAPCIRAAADRSVFRRPDGIVIIDPEKARGRKDLVKSCPYGAIWWNEEKSLPQKCTFCAHLLDDGWKSPRCVQACPTGALAAVWMDEAALAERIESVEGIAGIELNISCPNVKTGGIAFGVDERMAREVVRAVRVKTTRPLMVKLSPNVTDITRIAGSAIDGGADALSLINTITGMAIDIRKRRSKIANMTGGLSGPAIKPIALRMVWQVAQMSSVPVVGIGGISTAEDALEFIIAGASAVQVGTANFVDPAVTLKIVDGIERYMTDHGISRLSELIGSLEP